MEIMASTSSVGNTMLKRAAGEEVDIEYDPQSAEECSEMWMEIGDKFTKDNPQFANSMVFSVKDGDNYILGLTAENEELSELLWQYYEEMTCEEGPLANAGFVLHGHNWGIPDHFETEFGLANRTRF